MLAAPHMLVGAAVSRATRQAWIACPAAFASHFLLDRLPHMDAVPIARLILGWDVTDTWAAVGNTLLGVVLLTWALWGQSGWKLGLAGAFCGLLPDVLDFVPPVSVWFHGLPKASAFGAFHHACQGDVPPGLWPLGIGMQVMVVAGAILYLRARPRPA